ncbi:hypothetical protein AX14_008417 [Amanita brunnescens Koide BX004]|nr:hypothetical protein AX14_008417 [Amanita brunnescens Koide BX004]
MTLQKRWTTHIVRNLDFLVANDGVWTRFEPNGSPVGKIVLFSKVVKSLYYKDPELWVKVNAKEYLIQDLLGNVEPADDLYGTWERKETGSMMKIERDIHNWFKFEIIDEGEWVKEDPQSDLESPIREFSFIRQNQLPCLKSKV